MYYKNPGGNERKWSEGQKIYNQWKILTGRGVPLFQKPKVTPKDDSGCGEVQSAMLPT